MRVTRASRLLRWLGIALGGLALCWALTACLGCARFVQVAPTPTPNYPALETHVARVLGATLTAKAPTATATPEPTLTLTPPPPTPTSTPFPTPTPEPTFSGAPSYLAYVRRTKDESANIVLYDVASKSEQMLTHFAEPIDISDLAWSKDGRWLLFVSSHAFLESRDNERNVFMMRPDGTDLHMLTGESVRPDKAPPPYAVLTGEIVGAQGTCRVCAQGTSPVSADEQGRFELPGVPISSKWVRAMCQDGELILQANVSLVARADSPVPGTDGPVPGTGGFEPVSLSIEPQGQGWRQASLSRDGQRLAGVYYRWSLAEEKKEVTSEGVLYDIRKGAMSELALPPEMTPGGPVPGTDGFDWSPIIEDQLAGALTGESGTGLWRWDAQGALSGPLVEIPNPDDEILSVRNPVWSPDGSQVAFELRRWYWWGGNTYKTELMVVSANGEDLHPLVETDWGTHATAPSWSSDGGTVYYQLSTCAPEDDFQTKMEGDIWSIALHDSEPVRWTEDGVSYLPAAHP